MNRIIDFRVFDLHKGRYIPNDVYCIFNLTSFNAFGKMLLDWEDYREGEYFYDGSQLLEQSIGLTDKTGTIVFENDLVSKMGMIFKVSWNQLHASWGLFTESGQSEEEILCDTTDEKGKVSKFWRDSSLTIIGNIHETPELLK